MSAQAQPSESFPAEQQSDPNYSKADYTGGKDETAAPPARRERRASHVEHMEHKKEEDADPMKDPSKKPFGTDFQQQTMKHFYPQHEPRTIVLCLFLVAIVFLPIGAAIVVASDAIYELEIRYDQISSCTSANNQGAFASTVGNYTVSSGCITRVPFQLTQSLTAPVYIYYRITNMYQSYRTYAISKSETQLTGTDVTRDDVSDCYPWDGPGIWSGETSKQITVEGQAVNYKNMVYNPCGAIAWSMFNDTINLYKLTALGTVSASGPMPSSAVPVCLGGAFNTNGDSTSTLNRCTKKGIAISIDKSSRFVHRESSGSIYSGSGYNASRTDDPYFAQGFYTGEPGHRIPRNDDEDFLVWSRLAGVPDFRKLYRKIDVDLNAGPYALDIQEVWDSRSFEGEKYVILATTSWIGGKNIVLGALYLVMGSLSFVMAIGFLVAYLLKNRPVSSVSA